MTPNNLDYSGLQASPSITDLKNVLNQQPTSYKLVRLAIPIVILFGGIVYLPLVVGFLSVPGSASPQLLPMAIVPIAALFGTIWWGSTSFRQLRDQARLTKFCSANTLPLSLYRKPSEQPGIIFNQNPSDDFIREAIDLSPTLQTGNYWYRIGSGKNSRHYNFGYFRIKLTNNMPNMVLDAKSNNFLGISDMPTTYARSQKFHPEGNFSDVFTLYVPDGYETAALYLLTPDVLQTFLQFPNYNFEIVDNYLYAYIKGEFDLSEPAKLQQLQAAASALSAQLGKQASTYSPQGFAPSTPGVLRRGFPWKTVAIFTLYALWIILKPTLHGTSGLAGALPQIAILLAAIAFGYKFLRNRKH